MKISEIFSILLFWVDLTATQLYAVHENCFSLAAKQAIRLDAHLLFGQNQKHTFFLFFFLKTKYAPWNNIWTTNRTSEDFLHFLKVLPFNHLDAFHSKVLKFSVMSHEITLLSEEITKQKTKHTQKRHQQHQTKSQIYISTGSPPRHIP